MSDEHFTTKQVAEALLVSESSVKRWCDSGVIPTTRTAGGHRRISMAGLMEFLESTNRRLMNRGALGLAEPGHRNTVREAMDQQNQLDREISIRLQEEFEQAIARGDESLCRRSLTQWYGLNQSVALLADRLVATTFQHLGHRWECGEMEVYQERRGCEICARLIHELGRMIPEASARAPLAIGGAPHGDHYQLPSQLVEMVLRESGWRATNLGDNLPFETLLRAVRDSQPKLFWLSVSHIEDEEGFVEQFARFSADLPRDVTLVVGGRALHDRLRPRLTFTAHCDTMQQMASFAAAVSGFRPHLEASSN
jgi:excisionase family DNA binding protein